MEARDLFSRELKRLAPLKEREENTCVVEITSEVISRWAVEIGRKAFESDESASSDGNVEE